MKSQLTTLLIFAVLIVNNSFSQHLDPKPEKIGEEVIKSFATPHPYIGNETKDTKKVWEQEIYEENATYVAVHFKKIKLSKDDYLIVRNPGNTRSWKYSFSEIYNKNNKDGFWSIHIYGERAILEIFSSNSKGGYGYDIDKIAIGFIQNDTRKATQSNICGQDDTLNAICYINTEPFVYDRSRAVARILIGGTNACTGWLIGDSGHLMTNNHCIENQSDANNITVEFMAEGASCNSDCVLFGSCVGTIVATSATLIKTNMGLDYTLLALPTNVTNMYGFLQLRPAGAILNERIYMPQHPLGGGKKIGILSDEPASGDGFARVITIDGPNSCSTGNNIGYYIDTLGGSSGSPVISYLDNLVVGLHFCGGCLNTAIPIEDIITDLGNDLPNNAIPIPVDLFGDKTFCDTSPKTYTLLNSDPTMTPIWAAHPTKLEILSSTNTQVIVRPTGVNVTGTAWVEAVFPTQTIRKYVWIGLPLTPSVVHGPSEVNSGSWATYTGGALGATYYEWLLPYPFTINNPIDFNSDYWQMWPTASGYNSHIWTGNGGIAGYVQLISFNPCGEGGSQHIWVVHNNGNPCTSCESNQPFPYPNVANENFSLDFSNHPNSVYYIKIYDVYSNVLLYEEFRNIEKTFDTSYIPEGNYFLHIYDGVDIIMKQLVIKH